MGFIIIVAIIAIIGYYLSLRLHPYTKCRVCDGKGRHYGAVYTYAHRPCRKCGGRGRKDRFGVRFLNQGGSQGANQSGSRT
jgi:DnaJ-class molecular chaperone